MSDSATFFKKALEDSKECSRVVKGVQECSRVFKSVQ
jgi:hypothetical protein